MAKEQNFSFSSSATDVLTANPGLSLSVSQLQAIQSGVLVTTPWRGDSGCIQKSSRYEGDTKLVYMVLDGTAYSIGGSGVRVANLNDFRETLRSAFANGQRISFCFNTRTHKMSMLNVYKCGCPCDQ